jgi:hypothetical protein
MLLALFFATIGAGKFLIPNTIPQLPILRELLRSSD